MVYPRWATFQDSGSSIVHASAVDAARPASSSARTAGAPAPTSGPTNRW
ncbi:hypothetical protein [Kitasatospora phosalacinea]|nr:hypothetical protein [Kitasatospora phosalacinea]